MTTERPAKIAVRYEVPAARDDWTLPEEPVPESQPHDLVLELLKGILSAWIERARVDAQVARNLAVRWVEEQPRIGVDPDLCLITPRTPEGDELESLCTWREGHAPPLVAIEVVSASHARKDYESAPDKYAASGTRELWVFDPKLAGPRSRGGPHRIQVWQRDADGGFTRTYAGAGPVFSPALGAYAFAVSDGSRLRIAGDAAGNDWWMTAAEAERAAKEAALARIAELEAVLARGPGAHGSKV